MHHQPISWGETEGEEVLRRSATRGHPSTTTLSEAGELLSSASPAFRDAVQFAAGFASADHHSILITGPTGTGKNILARWLHEHSPRAGRPFEYADLGATDETFAHSELFGHEKGAFTGALARRSGVFERAAAGTVHLDEIGSASIQVQRVLLQVVDTGRYSLLGGIQQLRTEARIIASTSQDLDERCAQHLFLPDLLHRVNVLRLRLPALTERREDIPGLAERFVAREWASATRSPGARPPRIRDDLMRLLLRYPWPGNIRELATAMARLVIQNPGESALGPAHLNGELMHLRGPTKPFKELTLAELEQLLHRCNDNVTQLAELVGRNRTHVHNRLTKLRRAAETERAVSRAHGRGGPDRVSDSTVGPD